MMNNNKPNTITMKNNIGYIIVNIDNVTEIKNTAVAMRIALNRGKSKYSRKCVITAITKILPNTIIITCSFKSIF